MSLNPLDGILKSVEKLSVWESYQQHCRLIQIWEQVVDSEVAQRTRPLHVNRNILWVATASATWAQTLSLRRQSLLLALNPCLDAPLDGIRFSAAHWSHPPSKPAIAPPQNHPSQIIFSPDDSPIVPSSSPQIAFQRWAERLQQRSQYLILCPCCQFPTPPGEVERWSCCAYCMRQQWGNPIAKLDPPPDNSNS